MRRKIDKKLSEEFGMDLPPVSLWWSVWRGLVQGASDLARAMGRLLVAPDKDKGGRK